MDDIYGGCVPAKPIDRDGSPWSVHLACRPVAVTKESYVYIYTAGKWSRRRRVAVIVSLRSITDRGGEGKSGMTWPACSAM